MARTDVKNSKNSYICNLYASAEEKIIFDSVKKSIVENGLRQINIDEVEGRMLEILISVHGASKIVEIGTLAGYSTLWLAKALPEGGKLYSFEFEEKAYDVAKRNIENSPYADKIEVILGDAHEKLSDIEGEGDSSGSDDGKFDAIFIDAEKRGYPAYLDWAEENIRKNGLIIADNTLLGGAVYNAELQNDRNAKLVAAINIFNERLADTSKYQSIIFPTDEGLSVAKKLF